jgi:opacity protein-like surface antigen
MRKTACILPLALALALAWPAGDSHADNSVAVWVGWHFSHENDLDTWKIGGEYEYRTRSVALPVLDLALALPFEYYEVEPERGRFDDIDVTTYSLMPTAKVYLMALPALHPYIGAGVGWARTELGHPLHDTEDSLAWRVLVGAEYVLFPASPFLIFGEFEYTEIELDDRPGEPDVGGDAVLGGVRLRF